MKLTLSAAAFVLLGLLGLSALSQVNDVVVQGEIVDRDTGLPLAGARVVLERNPPIVRNGSHEDQANYDLVRLATAPVAFTDSAGMFRITTSTLDGYVVHVDAKGYVPGADGCHLSCKFKTGEPVNIKIRLVRSGVVTGTITEVSGGPIANLPVRLVRRQYAAGHDTLEAAYGVFTDDRGQYRLYDVEPGRYYLLAGSGLPVYLDNAAGLPLSAPSRLPDVYGHLYYPGVLSSDDAGIIVVKPGGENTGMDFTVSRPVTHRIRARVIDSRTGQAPAEARFAIIEQNTLLEGPERSAADNFVRNGARSAYDAASGRLDLPNLAPGTYFISATVIDRRLPGMPRDAQPAELFGSATVEVTNADVENVDVTVFPHGAITGRIRLTGRTGGTNINHFDINLVASKPGGDSFASGYAKDDGTFHIEDVRSGDYRVVVSNGYQERFYVQSMLYNNVDVLADVLHFPGVPAGTLDITVSTDGGEISGTVSDPNGKPAGHASVALLTDSIAQRPDLLKVVSADASGKFIVSQVAPGTYRIVCWEADSDTGEYDLRLLQDLALGGRIIRISELGRETVNLSLTAGNRR